MLLMKSFMNSKSNKVVTIEDIQPMIRAMVAGESHIASQMPNGFHNSRMFQDLAHKVIEGIGQILETKSEPVEIIQPVSVIYALADTHRDIDMEADKMDVKLEYISAVHHVLDWLIDSDYMELFTHEPRILALKLYGTVNLISQIADPEFDTGVKFGVLHRKVKTAFSGSKEYESELHRIAEIVLCNCRDPLLLLPNIVSPPDEWRANLEKEFPCLLKNNLDNSLPIPSPFY